MGPESMLGILDSWGENKSIITFEMLANATELNLTKDKTLQLLAELAELAPQLHTAEEALPCTHTLRFFHGVLFEPR